MVSTQQLAKPRMSAPPFSAHPRIAWLDRRTTLTLKLLDRPSPHRNDAGHDEEQHESAHCPFGEGRNRHCGIDKRAKCKVCVKTLNPRGGFVYTKEPGTARVCRGDGRGRPAPYPIRSYVGVGAAKHDRKLIADADRNVCCTDVEGVKAFSRKRRARERAPDQHISRCSGRRATHYATHVVGEWSYGAKTAERVPQVHINAY